MIYTVAWDWFNRVATPYRRRFVLNAFMLSLVVNFALFGVASVVRGFPSTYIYLTVLAGVLGGMWVASSKINKVLLTILVVLAGFSAGFIFFGNLGLALTHLAGASLYSARQAWTQAGTGLPIDDTSLRLAWIEFQSGAQLAADRLQSWQTGVVQGKPGFDSFSANFMWNCLAWLLAVWAGWAFVYLRSPIYSATPVGILMVGSLNYASGDPRYLLPFLGLVGGWLAAYSYFEANKRWETEHIDFAEDLSLDIGFSASAVVLLLLVMGFTVSVFPVIHLRDITDWFNRARLQVSSQQQQVAVSLGLQLPTPLPDEFERQNLGSLPREHLLGSGPELSRQIVMSVQILRQPGEPPPAEAAGAPRYYWRALTYDFYTGLGWKSSSSVETGIARGDSLSPGTPLPSQYLLEQEVRLVKNQDTFLYATGALFSSDQGFKAAWRPIAGENPQQPATDLFGARLESDHYRALSLVNSPSRASLDHPSGEIPAWIEQRYLQIPAEMPARVRDLAVKITENAAGPYARAQSIETYLRAITYTLQLPAPPQDRDVVDYYLFDLKKGYCDYAASAMVMLARSVGLPARLVIGYAPGAYDIANDRYQVSEADAHSWPEIYFAGAGWVEFEPTGGLPEHALQPAPALQTTPSLEIEKPVVYQIFLWPVLLALGGGLLLAALLWLLVDRLRLARLSPAAAVTEVYRRYQKPASRLAETELTPSFTALELAAAVKRTWGSTLERLQKITRPGPVTGRSPGRSLQRRLQQTAARAAGRLDRLAELYNQAQFSPKPLAPAHAHEVLDLWSKLRLPLQFILRLKGFTGTLEPTEEQPADQKDANS